MPEKYVALSFYRRDKICLEHPGDGSTSHQEYALHQARMFPQLSRRSSREHLDRISCGLVHARDLRRAMVNDGAELGGCCC